MGRLSRLSTNSTVRKSTTKSRSFDWAGNYGAGNDWAVKRPRSGGQPLELGVEPVLITCPYGTGHSPNVECCES